MTRYLEKNQVPPVTAGDYASAILTSCQEYGINPWWYAAMLKKESEFSPLAVGTDGRGSWGISQMQVRTAQAVAAELGEDPRTVNPFSMERHPLAMIRYGARCLSDLLDQFGENYYWSTRAYNAGVDRIRKNWNGDRRYDDLSVKYYRGILRVYENFKHSRRK